MDLFRPKGTSVPVLMCHLVVKGTEKATYYPTNDNVMTVKQFADQMQYLHENGYYTLTQMSFIVI